jgi:hypothetical protein
MGMAHTGLHSSLTLAAFALIAPAVGCTVNSYSTPSGYTSPSYASAPRYESAPHYETTPRYASAPRYESRPAKPIASAERKAVKPGLRAGEKKQIASGEHKPKKPLSYTTQKPKKQGAQAPAKPEKRAEQHKLASAGDLGDVRAVRDESKPTPEAKRGGADSITKRVAAMARKKRLERERKGTQPDETSRAQEARKQRMRDALAAATQRKRAS